MKFPSFRAAAERMYAEIPDAYKGGIDGLVVSRRAVPHPDLPDVFTLGECLTESWPSEWQGPDTTRSSVVLHWGSFRALAALDPDFDWEEEIWETLTHELRHHLESLASEDGLEGVDYALDEDFKRAEGAPFDPWYYQRGDAEPGAVYRVEDHVFLERAWSAERFEAAAEIVFTWEGRRLSVPRPDRLGDVHFLRVVGAVEPPGTLDLVLVRRRSWWEGLKRMVGRARPVVLESQAEAR